MRRLIPTFALALAITGAALPSVVSATPAKGTKVTLTSSLSSIGASPYLQVALNASVSGTGTAAGNAASTNAIVSQLSFQIIEQSTTGRALSASGDQANSEIIGSIKKQPALKLITVGTTIYLWVNLTPLTSLAQLGADSNQIQGLQVLVGNRWFKIPASVVNASLPASSQSVAQVRQRDALERKLIHAIAAVLQKTSAKRTPNGFSQFGTIDALAQSITKTVAAVNAGAAGAVTHTAGTYRMNLTVKGNVASGLTFALTRSSGATASETLTVTSTIAHDKVVLTPPAGATLVTPAFLRGLGLA